MKNHLISVLLTLIFAPFPTPIKAKTPKFPSTSFHICQNRPAQPAARRQHVACRDTVNKKTNCGPLLGKAEQKQFLKLMISLLTNSFYKIC